jgi:hypothetical protein
MNVKPAGGCICRMWGSAKRRLEAMGPAICIISLPKQEAKRYVLVGAERQGAEATAGLLRRWTHWSGLLFSVLLRL